MLSGCTSSLLRAACLRIVVSSSLGARRDFHFHFGPSCGACLMTEFRYLPFSPYLCIPKSCYTLGYMLSTVFETSVFSDIVLTTVTFLLISHLHQLALGLMRFGSPFVLGPIFFSESKGKEAQNHTSNTDTPHGVDPPFTHTTHSAVVTFHTTTACHCCLGVYYRLPSFFSPGYRLRSVSGVA